MSNTVTELLRAQATQRRRHSADNTPRKRTVTEHGVPIREHLSVPVERKITSKSKLVLCPSMDCRNQDYHLAMLCRHT